MSKISEAYRRQNGGAIDLGAYLRRAGTITLFPPVNASQSLEFNKLVNRLLSLRRGDRGAVFAFASSAPGEGTSFVSYHVACILAEAYEQKVAWVEGNFLTPQRKLIGTDLSDFGRLLQDPRRVGDLPQYPSPLLIPAGPNLSSARGHFADENYPAAIAAMGSRFDFTILDLPPILKTTDTALMALKSDGLVVVIEQKFLKWEVIKEGIRSLEETGVPVLGAVINQRRFDLPKALYDRL